MQPSVCSASSWRLLIDSPDVLCATVRLSSCEVMDEGAAQRDCEQLTGLELKHSVISVRPLVGALGRSRSNSWAAKRSTALYLQGKNDRV